MSSFQLIKLYVLRMNKCEFNNCIVVFLLDIIIIIQTITARYKTLIDLLYSLHIPMFYLTFIVNLYKQINIAKLYF